MQVNGACAFDRGYSPVTSRFSTPLTRAMRTSSDRLAAAIFVITFARYISTIRGLIARRFWDDEEDANGLLVHKPGGAEHARWMFDYGAGSSEDEEAGYRFGAHTFATGEYVSIRDHGGELHTFKVTSVEPLGS